MGVAPLQSVLLKHPTHTPAVTLHKLVAPVHSACCDAEHCPHTPELSHAGVLPWQSPSLAHARHVCEVASQIGVVPPQLRSVVQATHDALATLQIGLGPEHAVTFVAVHCTHAPVDAHAGVDPPHSPSNVQARQ
jgi:hypothetical protein